MELEINPKNLQRICWLNAMTVADLASRINRARNSVYRAVRFPHQHAPTFKLISAALKIRRVK